MHPFSYGRATDPVTAVRTVAPRPDARYLAGGTGLIDLMKETVELPGALVDINALPLQAIEAHGDGLWIGALASNSAVAHHPLVVARYPMLAEALLSGASAQLRNMASVGGNLLQRTRCPYFRDVAFERCNKRAPGTGCGAREGFHRNHAIFGVSDACIATHASDMVVALIALDAVVHTLAPSGPRKLPLGTFYLPPGDHPERENVLEHGELITAVELPAVPYAAQSRYLKVRDRASYEFALTSAAVALEVSDGKVRHARIALGGVGTVPWRAHQAELALIGFAPTRESFERAADAEMAAARPLRDNAFKVTLGRHTIVRACELVTGGHT